MLGGDLGHPNVGSQGVPVTVGSHAGLDLGQQLQQIIRGELRRMLEVGAHVLIGLPTALKRTYFCVQIFRKCFLSTLGVSLEEKKRDEMLPKRQFTVGKPCDS